MIEFKRFTFDQYTDPVELARDIASHVGCNVMEVPQTLMPTGAVLYNSSKDINPDSGIPTGYYIGSVTDTVVAIYAIWWTGNAIIAQANQGLSFDFDCAKGSYGWFFEVRDSSNSKVGLQWFAGFCEDMDDGSRFGLYSYEDGNFWVKNEYGTNDFSYDLTNNTQSYLTGANLIAPISRAKSVGLYRLFLKPQDITQDLDSDPDNRYWKTFSVDNDEFIAPSGDVGDNTYLVMKI